MARRVLIPGIGLILVALLLTLGGWQLQRRAWKRDLIAQVDARLHAAPVPAPGPASWPRIGGGGAYTRVRLTGRFLPRPGALVQALTERGIGYWLIAPLQTDRGFTVLINRGFVPPEQAEMARRPIAGPAVVTGLLRLTEPGGTLLRGNDPAADRWYSRDVAAIARARRLGAVAPYFVDADATPNPGGWPVGGLTVVSFTNNHLMYAITWFALAALTAVGTMRLMTMRWSGGTE